MELYLHGKNLKDAKHVQELLGQMISREIQLEEYDHDEAEEDDDDNE